MGDTCLYLARVGFDSLNVKPTPIICDDEDRPGAYAEAERAATLSDHAAVRELLLEYTPKPRQGDLDGAKWLRLITWPDRLPGLKTWAGQSTLPKIIAGHLKRLANVDGDLFTARGVIHSSKGQGASGLDALNCQDALDIGFSPSALGMDIECRPAVELLAIIGLETLPLVSFGPRDCGFIHNGKAWRFPVEERAGGYAFRWGPLSERPLDHS